MNTHEVGDKYQDYVRDALRYVGYQCESTSNSRDKGCDLVLTINPYCKIAIQCKWSTSAKVNCRAVQEIVAAKAVYDAAFCAVVTNNKFTSDAYELAELNGVVMVSDFGYESSVFDILSELGLMPTVLANVFKPILNFAFDMAKTNVPFADTLCVHAPCDEDNDEMCSNVREERSKAEDVAGNGISLDGSIDQLPFHKKTLRVLRDCRVFTIKDLLAEDIVSLSNMIGVSSAILRDIVVVTLDAGLVFDAYADDPTLLSGFH